MKIATNLRSGGQSSALQFFFYLAMLSRKKMIEHLRCWWVVFCTTLADGKWVWTHWIRGHRIARPHSVTCFVGSTRMTSIQLRTHVITLLKTNITLEDPFSLGNTSSTAGCSIVMLVFGGVIINLSWYYVDTAVRLGTFTRSGWKDVSGVWSIKKIINVRSSFLTSFIGISLVVVKGIPKILS